MKDLCQYGNRPEDEWEILPWIPDPRPPFKIWVKLEQIAPFVLIPHHPYAISLLLKISDGFRAEEFCRLGLTGSSGDWERLVRTCRLKVKPRRISGLWWISPTIRSAQIGRAHV